MTRLRLLREEQNMSQGQLAEIMHLSDTTISNYENGKREPPYATLIELADYFDVSIDYLLERTDGRKLEISIPNDKIFKESMFAAHLGDGMSYDKLTVEGKAELYKYFKYLMTLYAADDEPGM